MESLALIVVTGLGVTLGVGLARLGMSAVVSVMPTRRR
jgi:hypothetical protein